VRNKALVDARNVRVALWRGSPDNCLDEACLLDDNALSTLVCTATRFCHIARTHAHKHTNTQTHSQQLWTVS
jgi:alpha-D-ribose 1-methylphosphonate 5-phosphate C-P lyase